MAIIAKSRTYSGSHPVELSDTTASVTSLYNDLVTTDASDGQNVTFLSSSYGLHEKGDVTGVVVYSTSAGTHDLRCHEIYECRSQYGMDTFTFTGWTNEVGVPEDATTGNEFIYRINKWLDDNFGSTKSNITILDMHFRIDSTGQKRFFVVYDYNAPTSTVTYYAKLYSQNQFNILTKDGPESNFQTDLTALAAAKTIDHMFSAFDVDPNGDRHILAIYGTTAS